MSGSSSQKQTQQTVSEPWKAAQPALQTGLNAAQDLYKSGVGGQQYGGSTVVPYSWQSIVGQNNMQNAAEVASGNFLNNFNSQIQNNLNGGLNSLQNQSVGTLQGIAQGNPLNGVAALNDVQGGALKQLQGIAGANPAQNPFLEQIIASSARDVRDNVGLSAAGAGRYGSGAHQSVLADSIADMSSGLRYSDYGNQMARQDAAIRDVASMGGQANAQYESAMGRKFDALGSIYNAGQQQQENIRGNTGALQAAYQAWQSPFADMMNVGAMGEDLATRQMNADLAKFQFAQQSPWDQIGRLQAIASGAGQMGRTDTGYAQAPSRLASMGSGAISGLSMSGGNPFAALLGAGVGAFG